jgi:hypothetical protein
MYSNVSGLELDGFYYLNTFENILASGGECSSFIQIRLIS